MSYGAFAGKVFAHAMVGGIMSVVQGGKFGNGFAAAGFTQAFSGAIDKIGGNVGSETWMEAGNRAARIAVAAVVGGTASVLSGGKFANGAITGAFSRAFNDEAVDISREKALRRYNALKDRINGEIEDGGGTARNPINLDGDDIASLTNQLKIATQDQEKYSFWQVRPYFKQYSTFDSFMHSDFADYQFKVGDAIYSGSDINYIGIGMLATHYNEVEALPLMIIGWKAGESLANMYLGVQVNDYKHIYPAMQWAKYGSEHY